MLIPSLIHSLNELKNVLHQLSDEEFSAACAALSGSTIGQHTRHIIEMFHCLNTSYTSGTLNYDLRERNNNIQTNTKFALICIQEIQKNLDKPNKEMNLSQVIAGEEINITSNYYRELLYNLEHCMHHQALLKVALLPLKNIKIESDFGVARSTIAYRNTCVQLVL
jgi:hypothetical protein